MKKQMVLIVGAVFILFQTRAQVYKGLSIDYNNLSGQPITILNNTNPDDVIKLPSLEESQFLNGAHNKLNLNLPQKNNTNMLTNRRLKYSSLWAFTSLNYLYADLVGLMDVNLLSQYQTGVVNGIDVTPGFLTAAAAYMQLPLSNVFLPLVIKNERTLRVVQIISGSLATLIQGATLFVGKPAPYYVLFFCD